MYVYTPTRMYYATTAHPCPVKLCKKLTILSQLTSISMATMESDHKQNSTAEAQKSSIFVDCEKANALPQLENQWHLGTRMSFKRKPLAKLFQGPEVSQNFPKNSSHEIVVQFIFKNLSGDRGWCCSMGFFPGCRAKVLEIA